MSDSGKQTRKRRTKAQILENMERKVAEQKAANAAKETAKQQKVNAQAKLKEAKKAQAAAEKTKRNTQKKQWKNRQNAEEAAGQMFKRLNADLEKEEAKAIYTFLERKYNIDRYFFLPHFF